MKRDLLILSTIIILLIFLFISCAIIAYLLYFTEGAQTNAPPSVVPNGTIPAQNQTNPPSLNETVWDLITKDKVEQACLTRAKEEAGSSADLVYSCTCEASENPDEKRYECLISTADPFTAYFANIDCFLASETCSIESNYGQTNISFTELEALYQ